MEVAVRVVGKEALEMAIGCMTRYQAETACHHAS
jgi:hypothetical protein